MTTSTRRTRPAAATLGPSLGLVLALALGLAPAVAGPAPAAAGPEPGSPAYAVRDARNVAAAYGRITGPGGQLRNPAYLPALVEASTRRHVDQLLQQAATPTRPAVSPGNLAPGWNVGNPLRAGWAGTRGRVRDVAFTNRHGALLRGRVWAPLRGARDPYTGRRLRAPYPLVVVTPGSVQGSQGMYEWLGQDLAERGYVVLTYDVQGQGTSETLPHPDGSPFPACDPTAGPLPGEATGCPGVPSQQLANFVVGTRDALGFALATPSRPWRNPGSAGADVDAANPFWRLVDHRPDHRTVTPGRTTRAAVVGHSLGASAVSIVQGRDRRVQTVVALDKLGASVTGGGAEGVEPVVPALGVQSEYGFTVSPAALSGGSSLRPEPSPDGPDPRRERATGWEAWDAAGVDSMLVVPRSSTHLEYTDIPLALPASRWGQALTSAVVQRWLDHYLKHRGPGGLAARGPAALPRAGRRRPVAAAGPAARPAPELLLLLGLPADRCPRPGGPLRRPHGGRLPAVTTHAGSAVTTHAGSAVTTHAGSAVTTHARVGSGGAGDGGGEADEVADAGHLGVEEVRAPAAPDEHHLVVAERGGDGDVDVVELHPRGGGHGGRREVARGGPGRLHPLAGAGQARRPVGAEGDGQQVGEALHGLGRLGGQVLDGLEVEHQAATGGVAVDPHDADALDAVARGDDRVGHGAGRGLEQDVVDGRAVALLDDLDGLDVAAGLTDGPGDAAQGPRDVGQLDAEQERHDQPSLVSPVGGSWRAEATASALRPHDRCVSRPRVVRIGSAPMSEIDGVSETFDPEAWDEVPGFEDLTDLTYHRAREHGTVRVAFDRPDVMNAFRPHTVDELLSVLEHARTSSDVGCVLLTGNGPGDRHGKRAFCTGGDQRIRGRAGYQYAEGETAATVDRARLSRLHILEVQRLVRFMPKVVVCVVNGWTAGGGHSLHVVCDLTIASAEHALFKQTDADVGSFDAGYGSAYLARQVGQKKAREIFFLGQTYDAAAAERWGTVNAVVPHAELEATALEWGRLVNRKSPTAQRMLKFAFNAVDDGLVGQQIFAGETTRLAYMTDEAQEGRDQFLEKREPDWSEFPWYY